MVLLKATRLVSVLSIMVTAFSLSSSSSSSDSSLPDSPEPSSSPDSASDPRISLLRPLYFCSFSSYFSSNLKTSEILNVWY